MKLDIVDDVCFDEDDLIGEPDPGFGEGGESYSEEWRTARDEAISLEHLMDHYPKNRFCRACQWGKRNCSSHDDRKV